MIGEIFGVGVEVFGLLQNLRVRIVYKCQREWGEYIAQITNPNLPPNGIGFGLSRFGTVRVCFETGGMTRRVSAVLQIYQTTQARTVLRSPSAGKYAL